MEEEKQKCGGGGGGTMVVVVEPKPRKGLTSKVVDFVEKLIVNFMHDSTSQPLYYLSGNFAPVAEETPPASGLHVKGFLPDCLNGVFVRVGPNPKFTPLAGYHWFDGDGCKTLTVCHPLPANTALIYHHGKLLALSEPDKPYVLKVLEDGDLQTLGMLDYDKRLTHSFTAHPKVDPFTGEMFTFGYSDTPPYITYRVISMDGFMHDLVPITISEPIMIHDFAITQNYAIFMDLPLYFRPKEMVKEKQLLFTFDATKRARFGVLPRYAKDELLIKWFELPNCFIFHNANAWEEEDEVVLITCRLENPDLDMFSGIVKEKHGNLYNELYEMRFNMTTGLASQKKLSASGIEFPRVNESYTGRKQRYVYGTAAYSIGKFTGIIKFDLHAEPETGKTKLQVGGNVTGICVLGPGRFVSEAIFVPRVPGVTSEEDDGYLIFFVHDENTGKSSVHVIDAKTMSADPVAVVELPNRVPYGFHALFVSEDQLQDQAKL
ncbi:carotenoid 9,10(9',10')-cleavage dioxygenase 1-like [Corylus avellana]|uniref:carotenoid 9,10(9',10')-cleavage dioxygenase 1-like n=1 Tax=Corylus avellana TaxID=13451 RepID=UPI00286CCEC2|nr:carotenoid 9,10(9',10')-cleavage dioxygenase 1-like [Corylus avellana]